VTAPKIGSNRGGAGGSRPILCQGSDRDIPLAVKYETKPIWREASAVLGTGPTGAAIATALYEAAMTTGAGTSYSRSRDYYAAKKRHPLLSYRKTIQAVEQLAAGGFIEDRRQAPGGRGWQSSMSAAPSLVQAMPKILASAPRLIVARPAAPILLRDANGFDVDVPPTREVVRMGRKVEAINEALTSADVRAANGLPLASPVVRIFNTDTKLRRGGRMYAAGTSWQNIPKMDRSRIKIDDEPVVEIDFATLHPALLYAEAGAPLPTDCYSIGNWPRHVVKLGLLTLINAPTVGKARLSLAHDADFSPAQPGDQQAFNLAVRLIEDIKHAHRPIARAFHSDAGARLMRQDSDLAIAVVTSLMSQGVLALPVHDSFLVPVSKRGALETAMLAAAHAIGLREIRVSEG
jgi:hypothetical protein